MVVNKLDEIEIRLQKAHDFSWLGRYGTAFWSVDETGSGCVCIGMRQGETKYFCKIAGVNTLEADVSPQESVEVLKNAVSIYRDLEHPNLIKLVDAYDYEKFFVAVFEWAEGECLFDYWNFEKYQKDGWAKSPKERFKNLPAEEKLEAVDVLFSFLQSVNEKGYIAVDFYDGSLMYDFENKQITICDIDLFRKAPVINDMGEDWPGTKRLKAPEEYELNSSIDAQTNIFTLGALFFEFFGTFTGKEMEERYRYNRFLPCSRENWQLSEEKYRVAVKAVQQDRKERYKSLKDFYEDWIRNE